MRTRIYVSVQGKTFNPGEFHKSVKPPLIGHVRRRKHGGKPLTDVPLEYWSTAEIEVTGDLDLALAGLLEKLLPAFPPSRCAAELEVMAHIVIEFMHGEEPKGLFLSRNTIRLLGEVGAQLDIDAVPHVPRTPA